MMKIKIHRKGRELETQVLKSTDEILGVVLEMLSLLEGDQGEQTETGIQES